MAKVRLDAVEFERTGGFNPGEQGKILEIIRDYRAFLLEQWNQLYPPEETQGDE